MRSYPERRRSKRTRTWAACFLLNAALAIGSGPDAVSRGAAPAAPAATGRMISVDMSATARILEVTQSWGSFVGDVNGDSLPDVMVNQHYRRPAALYRNIGGRFTEMARGSFLTVDRHDCAWVHVDGNHLIDVFCATGANWGRAAKVNELWMQGPAGTFTNRAVRFGVEDVYGRGRAVAFLDVERDGDPDLFLGNTFPREDPFPSPNRFFINENGTAFREAPGFGLNREIGGRCAQAADYDADGWDDLLVCTGVVGGDPDRVSSCTGTTAGAPSSTSRRPSASAGHGGTPSSRTWMGTGGWIW